VNGISSDVGKGSLQKKIGARNMSRLRHQTGGLFETVKWKGTPETRPLLRRKSRNEVKEGLRTGQSRERLEIKQRRNEGGRIKSIQKNHSLVSRGLRKECQKTQKDSGTG